jgi:PBP1b-binding outer membrane lipoprotein LpoB
MKLKMLIAAACAALLLSGCDKKPLTPEQKQNLEDQIINNIAMQGQNGAQNYIDCLIAEGKMSPEIGAKVKDAIPKGIEKVKEVLKTKRAEKK